MALNDVYKLDVETHKVELAGAVFEIKHLDYDSIAYKKAVADRTKGLKRFLRVGGELPQEKDLAIRIQSFIAVSLVGWENLRLNEGDDPIPYSPEKAEEVFTAYPRVFSDLAAEATDMANFRKNALVDVSKN